MIILRHRSFDKSFKKLDPNIQEQLYQRLRLFDENRRSHILRDHVLKGKYEGYRSINVTGDIRAVYKIERENVVIFVAIGSHSELYE